MSVSTLRGKNAQIREYQSFAIKTRNSDIFTRMNTGMEGHFIKNDIRLGRTKQRYPSTWEEGSLTATQIVEGKTSKKVMRSQKLMMIGGSGLKWLACATT
jgi:hypothetical protein